MNTLQYNHIGSLERGCMKNTWKNITILGEKNSRLKKQQQLKWCDNSREAGAEKYSVLALELKRCSSDSVGNGIFLFLQPLGRRQEVTIFVCRFYTYTPTHVRAHLWGRGPCLG